MTDSADEPKRPRPQTDATIKERTSRTSQPAIAAEPDFGPRYRVLGMLGKGGMGEVYRAYDVELRGEVALKVVRADHDSEAALARFRREIALARKVTSPNVLRVYDLAEHGGLRFLTMEYVEGDDLAALLKRERRLPLERALSIFRQVATGLVAAHAQGVVHRDLKPQNVLVDHEGNVRVADFGLARSIADSGMTASGAVLGSPAYMSPEQVKGEPTDERSDIYALGVMLYQLAAGQTPFQAPTPHAVMEMRLHKKPQALRELAPEVPLAVERVVARCLELEPAKRYATVTALLADLDGAASRAEPAAPAKRRGLVVAGSAAALLVGGGIALLLSRHDSTGSTAGSDRPAGSNTAAGSAAPPITKDLPSLAATPGPITTLVLGFDNRTPETEFEGTLDWVVNSTLRRSPRVDPTAGVQLRRLATELGPDVRVDEHLGERLVARDHQHVIVARGVIEPKGAGFALSFIAIDAATGAKLVDKSFDAPGLDRVVPTVARLACELRVALGEPVPDDERERTGLSASLNADHDYALGFAAGENGDYVAAAEHFRAAIGHDPNFALAHARRAVAFRNTKREAESAHELQAALKSIDQMGERDRLKLLGDYYQFSSEDLDRAIASYVDLLSKWPHDLAAATNLANAYQARGDREKALELARRAAHAHTQNLVLRGNVAAMEINADDFDGAVADVRKMLSDLPRPTTAMFDYLVVALAALNRHDDVVAAMPAYAKVDPSNAATFAADYAIAEGRDKEAIALLDKGVAKDLVDKNPDAAEIKLAMLAELQARRGDKAATRAAAKRVTQQPQRELTAALALLQIHAEADARAIAAKFAQELAPSRRVMARMIEGEALRVAGKPREAMIVFQDALKIMNDPTAHFLLARAALDAKQYTEAYSELEHCLDHRGEIANGPDDVSGVRYLPPLTYYLAKAEDGLGSPEAAATYKKFLALLHDPDSDDTLANDARTHVK